MVIGSKGSNTLFSCTWNEHRKKPHAQLAKAHGIKSFLGEVEMVMKAGRMATMVDSSETRCKSGMGYVLSLWSV